MKYKKTLTSLVAAATLAAVACSGDDDRYAATDARRMPVEADNTGKNVRDQGDRTLTAGDQSNRAPDVDLTQKIRQGITSDDAMSVQARNVKVITQDGVVTLRGPVETQEEKASIELLARTAGATRIDNQLEIDQDVDSGDYKE
jgi:hyperosmotically inducible protein